MRTLLDEIIEGEARGWGRLGRLGELEEFEAAYPGISCVTPGNPYVLHCFPPFKTELTREQHRHLDIIAEKIRRSFSTSRPITKVVIVGHSSTWHRTPRSKLEERAFQRAGNAGGQLILRLNRMGLAKRVDIETDGRSDTVRWLGKPYSSTSGSRKAQNDRALNRRVEIFLLSAEKKKKKKKPGKCPNLKSQLRAILDTAQNPTTRCLIRRLLDGSVDHSILPDNQLRAFMDAKIQNVGINGYTDFLVDMNAELMKRLQRINRVPTRESCQSRFQKSFERLKGDFLRGVKMLEFLDCYDRRTPAVRRFIQRRTKSRKSLYGCPVVAKQVEGILDRLGGTRGCGKGV